MTLREVSPEGLGRRTNLELWEADRRQLGIEGSSKAEYLAIRARWAQLTNEAFRQAGLQVRIDHRSYKERGINREPTARIPPKVFYAERQAKAGNAAGNEIRARHRERIEAREKGSSELARVLKNQQIQLKENAREHFKHQSAQPKTVQWGALTREERNAIRRERYQALREKEKADPVAEAKRRATRHAEHERRKQRNPEALREASRRWRHENPGAAQAIRQRYWDAHGEERNRNKRDKRRNRAQQLAAVRSDAPTPTPVQELPKSAPITAEESARRWHEYRQTHGPGPTAEESARAPWQKFLWAPVATVPTLIVAGIVNSMLGPLARVFGIEDSVLGLLLGLTVSEAIGYAAGRILAKQKGPAVPEHRRGAVVNSTQPVSGGLRGRSPSQPSGAITLANIPIPLEDETKHFKFIGTTGTDKSTAIRELLTGAFARGDRAIIADPDGGYASRFYNPTRGDVILNPFQGDGRKWDLIAQNQVEAQGEVGCIALCDTTCSDKNRYI